MILRFHPQRHARIGQRRGTDFKYFNLIPLDIETVRVQRRTISVKIFPDSTITSFGPYALAPLDHLGEKKKSFWVFPKLELRTPPLFGKKTTLMNVGMSRTSSLYNRSWSRTRITSTSNAFAAARSCR